MTYAKARRAVLGLLPKNAVGAEIGVWRGDFSAAILDVAKPTRLHLVDPWAVRTDASHADAWYSSMRGQNVEQIYRDVTLRFSTQVASGQVQIHRAPSTEVLPAFGNAVLDFIYIDGDHAHDAVRQDLELAVETVRSGGLICIDDHMRGKWWGDGIIRAVNECLGKHPRGLEIRFAANTQVVLARI